MKKIVFVATHGGVYSALKPVEEYFFRNHDPEVIISWVSEKDSVAGIKLTKAKTEFMEFGKGINYKQFSVVVTGRTGRAPGPETFCVQAAKDQGIPVAIVLDSWGNWPHDRGLAPDRLCVLDEPSVKYEARMRKMPKKNIRVTGNPKMDELMNVDISPEAHIRNRKKLGIGEGYFLVFTGPSGHNRVMEVFPALISAVKGGKVKVLIDLHRASGFYEDMPVTIGTLWHPEHKREKSGNMEEYYKLLEEAKVPCLTDEYLREQLSNNEIYVAADLVEGVTSTETIVSCYLRRPTLNIIYPGGINYNDILVPVEMASIPTVECGAALLAESASEVSEIINGIWQIGELPCPVMKKAQEEFYNLDGKNTERVVNAIKELL